MSKLNRLKREAMEACNFRRHEMTHWKTLQSMTPDRGAIVLSKCQVCGRDVMVLTRPMPNDIEIGGEAVAEDCQD